MEEGKKKETPLESHPWDAMVHMGLFAYMTQLHRQGTSTDKAALKLYYAEPLDCYKTFPWDDFYWAWKKAATHADWDPQGISDWRFLHYAQQYMPLPIIDYDDAVEDEDVFDLMRKYGF